MYQILKYKVELTNEFTIPLPSGAMVLCVQEQRNIPHLWVMGDTDNVKIERRFALRATGQSFRMRGNEERYIGTFQLDGGAFIGHLFEIG
jgi:hypothetical protein